jgi:hypothetical protein
MAYHTQRRVSFPLFPLLIATLACGPLLSACQGGEQAPPYSEDLQLQAYAMRLSPEVITYSIRLANPTDGDVGPTILRMEIPAGGAFISMLHAPPDAQFEERGGAITWTLPGLPAQSLFGPFVAQIGYQGEPPPVVVEARWEVPSPGWTQAVVAGVEDATQVDVSLAMRAGAVTDIPGTGLRYFVPSGERGEVQITRLDGGLPAGTLEGLTWVGAFQVTKEHSGSLILVAPLAKPAPPYSLVWVFVDEGDGILHQAPVVGTVSSDGLHATFAADGSSSYFLGVRDVQLTEGFIKTQGIDQLANEIIDVYGAEQAIDEARELAELIGSAIGAAAGGGEESGGMPYWVDAVTYRFAAEIFGFDEIAFTAEIHAGGETYEWLRDSDGDGLCDDHERGLGTNPYRADTDKDGLSDAMEALTGTDPLNPDTDGDGWKDGAEAGYTDPNNAFDNPDHRRQYGGALESYGGEGGEQPGTPNDGGGGYQQPSAGGESGEEEGGQQGSEGVTGSGGGETTQESQIVDTGSCPPHALCARNALTNEVFAISASIMPASITDIFLLQLQSYQASNCAAGAACPSPVINPAWAFVDQAIPSAELLQTDTLVGIVGIVADKVMALVPVGQSIQLVVGQEQPPAPAPPPPEAAPEGATAETPEADVDGPSISSVQATPPATYKNGTSVISAIVSDPSGLASVRVRWRYQGEASWRETLEMSVHGGGVYQLRIPSLVGGFPQTGSVEFQIVAIDALGNGTIKAGVVKVGME